MSEAGRRAGIVTLVSPRSVADTVARIVELIDGKGMTVFAVVDHAAAARDAGLELRETRVVVFGSPVAGTPVMAAAPLVALDLPLKLLVWDDGGTTRIGYTDPAVLADRHGLDAVLSGRLAGITGLAEAAVAD